MKNKYSYPAVFTPEENGQYSVNFPDLESCYTCGDDLTDAVFMAEDVLALVLYEYEKSGKTIPEPSNPKDIHLDNGEFISYVAADTMVYRKMYNTKAVKKTLTIPEWMSEKATEMNLSFSQVLQDALIQRFNEG